MPERLPPATPEEQRAEALLRQVPAPPVLSEAAVERVWGELQGPTLGFRPRRRWPPVAWGVVAALAGLGAVALLSRSPEVVAPTPVVASPSSSSVSNVTGPSASLVPTPVLPAVPSAPLSLPRAATPSLPSAPVRHAPSMRGAPTQAPTPSPGAPPPVLAPPPVPSTADSAADPESAALAAAVRTLRNDHRPDTALKLLDGYDRNFPQGTFRGEASLLRAEALTAWGRRAEARALLEHLRATGAAPAAEVDRRLDQLERDEGVQGLPGSGDEERASPESPR